MKGLSASLACALAPIAWSCAAQSEGETLSRIGQEIERRTGHPLPPEIRDAAVQLPPGVDPQAGIGESDAVAVALWNNKEFLAALAELGLARADLVDAGMLSNPVFSILFPWGAKQMEFTAKLPLEVLWLRPWRVSIAELDLERTAAALVQNGLNLVRDVKSAMADLELARSRLRLAGEIAALNDRAAELAASMLQAGESSELEASRSRIDALLARERRRAGEMDLQIKTSRLQGLLGLALEPGRPAAFRFKEADRRPDAENPQDGIDLGNLVSNAFLLRPDLRAAELVLEVSRKRAGLSAWEVLQISGIADANENRGKGLEIGPGLEAPVPIFNQGQGKTSRARAAVAKAAKLEAALKEKIVIEVEVAYRQYEHGRAELSRWRELVLPELDGAYRGALKANEAGDISLLQVLQANQRLLEGRTREAEIIAALEQGRAELERCVGARLEGLTDTSTTESTREP